MFCRICGKQVEEGAAFCGSCGTAVAPATGPDVAAGADAPPAPAPTAPPVTGVPQGRPPQPDLAVTTPMPQVPASPSPYAGPAATSAPVAPHGAPAPVTVPVAARSSKAPMLVGVAAAVVVLVAAAVLWTTGVIPGWLNPGSKTTTSTVEASLTTTTVKPPVDETVTPPPTDAVLSDADSYQGLITEWDTLTSLRAAYGEKFPDASKGVGWVYETWSKQIGSKDSSTAREQLAGQAKEWAATIAGYAERFAALRVSAKYASYQQQITAIYALLGERADIYLATSEYAVDNPTVSKSKEPWRAVQDGTIGGGRSASEVLEELQSAAGDYTPPEAP